MYIVLTRRLYMYICRQNGTTFLTNAQAKIHFGTEFSWVCSALTVAAGNCSY